MVAPAAFPAAKLGALVLKQISKPIANMMKQHAKNSPVFRKYVCLPPAQFYNWVEVKSKSWLLNLGQPVTITVLNEAKSIELGANLLGEGIIFIIAAAILIAEYNRSARKELAKEEAKKRESEELQRTIRELFIQTEEQGAHIRELARKFGDLETKVLTKPWVKKEAPPPPEESVPSRRNPPPFLTSISEEIISDDQFPPSPDRMSSVSPDDQSALNSDLVGCKYDVEKSGLLHRAIYEIENEFWNDPNMKREPGILTTALNLLYRDVYRVPLKFY